MFPPSRIPFHCSRAWLTRIIYPSGRRVDYFRDDQGRIESVTTTHEGSTRIVVDNLTYGPFGPRSALTFGNGIGLSRYFDLDYRLTAQTHAVVSDLSYLYDAADNLVAQTDNRLTTVGLSSGTSVASYRYNGRGERVKKVAGATITFYHYDSAGRLIAETDAQADSTWEYIYLDDIIVAVVAGDLEDMNPIVQTGTGSSGNADELYYVHTDHLATPKAITDENQNVVWSADATPFGMFTTNGPLTFNLRFPGQRVGCAARTWQGDRMFRVRIAHPTLATLARYAGNFNLPDRTCYDSIAKFFGENPAMTSHALIPSIGIEAYLAAEEAGEVRHEYVSGQLFAMVGVNRAHNVIAGNFFTRLHSHLRQSPCRVFIADMKVRVKKAEAFYYPDVMVSCEPRNDKALYLEAPKLIVEVLSPTTENIDRREKRLAYQYLENLEEYVITAQDTRRVEVYRPSPSGIWEVDTYEGAETALLRSLDMALPLDLIYEDTEVPRPA
ncbi:MAG: Uma2 family endonuclease [Methylococcaceae bacterium]|nr:Uma2 family endonuclease [Methylococcaceae bacterium]